jgi:biofilm PGA synthesis N-glycosyltransferase PgaC
MNNRKYVLISSARNEEEYITQTLDSAVSQTVTPAEWIIVNDGSTDATGDIIDQYAKKYPWIKAIHKDDRGYDQVSRAELIAFNDGVNRLDCKDWDYVVKLDCDVSFEKDYFEMLLLRSGEDARIGICGGTSYVKADDRFFEEKMPGFHPWSGARMYRKACFDDIGGLPDFLGGETIDILNAHMKGWLTKRFSDLKVMHLRRMSSRSGLWEGKIRTGRIFYITGYHPLFLFARSMYRLKERPYFIESIGVICGYIKAMWKREPKVVTPEQQKFLRKQQIRRLFTGKLLVSGQPS